MAYPNGTIFDAPQSFPPLTEFGAGCVFASGSVFENPCIFGEGCVFSPGCSLIKTDPYKPPHQTANGCIFGEGCNIDYTAIGPANVIGLPGQYSPVSQGPNTIVGLGNNRNLSCAVTSSVPEDKGQIVTDCQVSSDWSEASNPAGFYGQEHLTIHDEQWGVNNG
jgi:hypothetical protein